MKYEIISRDDQTALIEAVDELLAAGWELQGGVSVTMAYQTYEHRDGYTAHDQTVLWAQALVKRS